MSYERSLFGGLLDRHKGGHFQVSPEGVEYVSKQLYLPATPILITRFSARTALLSWWISCPGLSGR